MNKHVQYLRDFVSDKGCHDAADELERQYAENSRLVDRVDLLEGVVRTCHLAFVEIPDLVSTEQTPVSPNAAIEQDCTQNGNTTEREQTPTDNEKCK